MRVVALDEDVLDANAISLNKCRWILNRAEPKVSFENLGWGEVGALPRSVHFVIAEHVIEAIHEPSHPSDSAFGHA